MTRIFDALRRAEAGRERAASPVTPMAPAAAHHGSAVRAHLPMTRSALHAHRAALPLSGSLVFTDDVQREMTGLRVSLEALLGESTPRTVMFVRPQGAEGTSCVALQFAGMLARDPALKVLIVDAHVRRPAYRSDEASRTAMPAASFAGAGHRAGPEASATLFALPAPVQLVDSGVFQPAALRQTLEENSPGFDWVVIDGPPVLESPDSAALAALADATLLVVQAGRTKRPVLARSGDMLRKAGARLVGSVLNRRVLEIPEFIYRRI